ncbi:hypothetical protein DRW07_00070 [Alteromonas sediminis]|uniref:Oligosaccharide repeat unit polymerase n=1 Tax=Alteromonas sediminis TaxID=2259342 RepID=A0A3N5Y9D8_9ALTE|nr:hypothetical protein [Alteromonas sediminis]RPJ67849.1 hypothetical protein DRW07_00070 [Alteromonas sediminis]
MFEHLFFTLSVILVFARILWEFFVNKGKISPLAIYSFCYLYFCFGPYLADVLGFGIYSGIQRDYMDEAAFVFFLAIATLALFPSNFVAKLDMPYRLVIKEPVLVKQITRLLLTVPVALLFALALAKIGFAPLDKVQRIAAVGIFHYVILTLWPLCLFCYLTVAPKHALSRGEAWSFAAIILLYFSYCFYMGERDFALIGVPLVFWFYKDKPLPLWKLSVGVVVAAVGFTLMSAGRSSEFDGGGLASFLNQGSNLMVTTNIILWLEQGQLVSWGASYFSSFINMLTLGAIKLTTPLSIWFSREYSPAANDGAFGFSIEGEALINFGIAGIPFLFAFIAFFLAWTYRGFLQNRPMGVLLTYYALFYFVYAIRGESLILFKAFIYSVIIFVGLLFISQRGRLYFQV